MDDEELLTVEEVAARLTISVASVRRKCARGEFEARKLGRSWVIPAASLPKVVKARPAPRRSARASSVVDLTSAMRHLRSSDLKQDVWVPDVLQFEDDLADLDSVKASAAARLDLEESFDTPASVPVPKSPFFPRNAVNLSLADRLAYQAAVATFALAIDAGLTDSAFAARVSPNPRYFLVNGRDAWLQWRRAVRGSLDRGHQWLVETDVTSFFDFVKHEILLPELLAIGGDQLVVASLREMLRNWSATPNTGIPQGPNASRLLANFYMAHVDTSMRDLSGVRYFRYMDDIRITAPTRAEAIAALQHLDTECRRRGLALSNKKTELHSGSAAASSMEDRELDSAQYAFDSGSESDAELSARLARIFSQAISRDGTVKTRWVRFSLSRLFRMRSDRVLTKVLKHLEALAPLGDLVPRYLYPWLRKPRVQKALTVFLMDPQRNTSVYLSTWLLAVMIDVSDQLPPEWIGYARSIATDRAQPSFHRSVAMSVLGFSSTARDVTHLEDIIRLEFDPEVVRGALVALARTDRLTKQTAKKALRISGMEATVEYLAQKRPFPSLVFGSYSYPVRPVTASA